MHHSLLFVAVLLTTIVISSTTTVSISSADTKTQLHESNKQIIKAVKLSERVRAFRE